LESRDLKKERATYFLTKIGFKRENYRRFPDFVCVKSVFVAVNSRFVDSCFSFLIIALDAASILKASSFVVLPSRRFLLK